MPSIAPLVADLPALLLAVFPLVQAMDWLETASAATLEALAPMSGDALPMLPSDISITTPLANEQAIERALASLEYPDHHGGGSVLVYAADIQPLSLTIDVGDLFSDAGSLGEVTPRFTSASFVANVENDIFGRDMNVVDTPLAAGPSKAGGGVTDVPIGGPQPTETDGIAMNDKPGGGKLNNHHQPGDGEGDGGNGGSGGFMPPAPDGEAYAVVDTTPPNPPKSDIVP